MTETAERREPSAEPSTVWLVEDNDLYRTTLSTLIGEQAHLQCPVSVASCEEALNRIGDGPVPDVVLMDIGLPGIDGIEGARRIAASSPQTRVIMLTVHEEADTVFHAIASGASGYLLKSSSAAEIVAALDDVLRGSAPINASIARKVLDMFARLTSPHADYGLTHRETEILQLMVDGLTMRAIAERLFVSYHTIDTHIRNIYEKLHVHSRSGAVAKALKEHLIS